MNFTQTLTIALAGSSPQGKFSADTIARLDKLGAFNGKPALRFIASTAMKSGITDSLLHAGGWNHSSRCEAERFIAHTGFRETLAMGFLDAYATCLTPHRQHASESSPADGHHSPAPHGNSGTDDTNLEEYSTINVDRRHEPECGIAVAHAAFNTETATDTQRLLRVTLHRTAPMGSGALHCSLHNARDTTAISIIAATMTVANPSPLTVNIPIPDEITPPVAASLCIK